MSVERLQKILAQAGVASRRAAEEMITAGRVAVDGVVLRELGSKADPLRQKITVDGQPLPGPEAKAYWLVHKPTGYVSTVKDPQGRRRVVDLLPPEVRGRLYPVGRLDYDSEGLILLTNDGELAHRLLHPRFGVPKLYRVWVAGRPSAMAIQQLREGVIIDGRRTAPARVHFKGGTELRSKLALIINEGRKREIRLMCEAVGHPVQRLVRVAMGPLHLGELPSGAARPLHPGEVTALKQAAGLISGCKPSGLGVKKSARATGGRTDACQNAAGDDRIGPGEREGRQGPSGRDGRPGGRGRRGQDGQPRPEGRQGREGRVGQGSRGGRENRRGQTSKPSGRGDKRS
ncbi:MAG: rRNA pseudouridine synthase [Desulfarculus sp.]|nr:rRNA pseudouridine synthase [Desulfarculus sp.]